MSHLLTTDPFADILSTTETNRARHGCGAYPYDKRTLLGVLAAAVEATRIIEVETALGYSALWLGLRNADFHCDAPYSPLTNVARQATSRFGWRHG